MPTVPRAPTTTGRIGFTPTAAPGAVVGLATQRARVFEQVAQIGEIAGQKLAQARRVDEFIAKSSEFNRGLTEIEANATDPVQFEQAAGAHLESVLGSITDGDVQQQLNQRGTFAIDSAIAGVTSRAAKFQRDTARAQFSDEVVSDYAESLARADIANNDVEVARLEREWEENLTATQHFDADEKGVLMGSLQAKRQSDAVRILIESAIAAPGNAPRLLAEADVRLQQQFSPDISTEERLSLRRQVVSAADSAEKRINDERIAAQRETSDGFLVRILSPDPDAFPSVGEVANSNLGRIEKEHYVAVIEAHNRGEDVARGVAAVEGNLIARVHDIRSPEPITDVSQLVPFLGNGLGTEMFATLRADIDRKNNPLSRGPEKEFSDMLASVKGLIVTPTIVIGADVLGSQMYNDFTLQAKKLWLEGREAGKTPSQLLLTTSPDYIGNIIPNFQKTNFEKNDAAQWALFPGMGRPSEDKKPPEKNLNETPAQYLERTGGGE